MTWQVMSGSGLGTSWKANITGICGVAVKKITDIISAYGLETARGQSISAQTWAFDVLENPKELFNQNLCLYELKDYHQCLNFKIPFLHSDPSIGLC